ncbi:MAG TPA: AAA family ATPase, partial [Burkholderiaceae bacterium]|nr:AAA family ATPase [Burkholderiaceae bacterium]
DPGRADRPVLHLLGRPRIDAGARAIDLSPKDGALMALAALAAPIRPERVSALLWPDASARQADASLRQRIYRLRRDTGQALLTGGATFGLDSSVTIDMAAALAGVSAQGSWPLPDLLGDLPFDALPEFAQWLHAQRQQWRESCRDALVACAERKEREGALAQAMLLAQHIVEADPLHEHGQRRLMRLHYLRGDRAAAIAVFERCERALKDELGARPSAETLQLLATIERADGALPRVRPIIPVGLLRPPRLIGREPELRACDTAWGAVRAFLVRGEAGVGKSRLLGEFQADQPGTVLVQARPGDDHVPYAVAARLLRAVFEQCGAPQDRELRRALALLLPEWGETVDAAGEAQRLLIQSAFMHAITESMASGLRGVLLDDLHFADDASLGLVKVLARGERPRSPLLGLAQRPTEGPSSVAALRDELAETHRLDLIELSPLTEAQMIDLVASLALSDIDAPSLGAALFRHTGGNPLFALETLKERVVGGGDAQQLPRPASVSALVERRLSSLSPNAQRLARVAALAGTDFTAELAADVLETHPLDLAEPWRELEAAQVIRDGAFAHDLIFEATRRSVPQPIARLLHRRIATLLSARGVAPAHVAAHWEGAAEWQACGAAYVAAARQARAASQRTHEVDCWRRAAAAYDSAGQTAEAFDARCESVPAVIVAQGVGEAQRVVEALLASAYDGRSRAAALAAKANAALMSADHATGIAAATEAAALVANDAAPLAGFEPARLIAVGYTLAGRTQEALEVIEPYRADIEQFGDAEQRGRFWADYAYVLNGLRRLRDTEQALQHGIENAQALGDIAELATMISNLATVKGNLGQTEAALELARRALALQTQLGALDGPPGAVVQTYVGLYSGAVGQYREALAHLDTALETFHRDRQATWIAVAAHHKAQWLIDLGQYARARQALEYDVPAVDSVRARGATIAARIARALGQAHDGLAAVRRAVAELSPGADPNVRMHVMLDDLPRDDPAAALARCDEVLALARRLEFAGVAVKANLLRVRLMTAAGSRSEAAALARATIAEMDSVLPADLYLGEAWWIAARAFDAAGDADDALMCLSRGARWIRRSALPQVPDEYVDSFLHRNPSNRDLLAAADRRLAAQ